MLTLGLVLLLSTLPQDPEPARKPSLGKVGTALGTSPSKAVRIPGGSEHEFEGMRFDLPATWKPQKVEAGLELVPAGANASGMLEEKYVLVHDPEITSLDGPALAKGAQELADSVQDGLKATGPMASTSFGDLAGRSIEFTGAGPGGKAVAVRVYAFAVGKKVCGLAALGFEGALAARAADLKAVLGSLRLATGPAAEPRPEPAAAEPASRRKPIPGGTTRQHCGVQLDVPAGWTVNETEEATVLTPPGANPRGVLEELYLLTKDTEHRRIEGAEALRLLDAAIAQVQAGVKRQGDGEQVRFGDVDGRVYLYTGADTFGKKVEVRVHAFLGNGAACALSAIGYADTLGKRADAVRAILDSMGAPVAGKSGDVRTELVGQWAYLSNFNANQGGSQTQIVLTLNGDGSYTYSGLSSSSNPLGGTVGESRERGTWSAGDGSLVLTCGGNVRQYSLVKRNHPKNVNDPMIVLDGKAFVTVTQRAPWR